MQNPSTEVREQYITELVDDMLKDYERKSENPMVRFNDMVKAGFLSDIEATQVLRRLKKASDFDPTVQLSFLIDDLLLTPEDESIVNSLPDLLGLKFCPQVVAISGVMPPLESTTVTPEYELGYLYMMKDNMSHLLHMVDATPAGADPFRTFFAANSDTIQILRDTGLTSFQATLMAIFISMAGGKAADLGGLNPAFPRYFWYILLGFTNDEFAALGDTREISAAAFNKERICIRFEAVCNAIARVTATIADIAAIAAEVATQAAVTDATDPSVPAGSAQASADAAQDAVNDAVVAGQEAVTTAAQADAASQQASQATQQDDDVVNAGIMDQDGNVVSSFWQDFDYDPGFYPTFPDPIASEVPLYEEKPFYKKTGNQALFVAMVIAMGLYLNSKNKKSKKVAPMPSLNPFRF